jgi:hypothetical protein
MTPRAAGRPPKKKGTAKTEVFSFKLSKQERKELEQAAGDEKVTTWARGVLLREAERVTVGNSQAPATGR